DLTRALVPQFQVLEAPGTAAARKLGAEADIDVGRIPDLADQVVGHARGEGVRADHDGDLARVLRQVQGGLPGRVPAADHERLLPDERLPLGRAGAVERPGGGEYVQAGNRKAPVGHAGGDDYRAAPDLAAVLEPDDSQIPVHGQRGRRVPVDEVRAEQPC